MDLKGKHVILGSNSPRRRELLAGLNIDFEVDTGNDFDESFSPETPYDEVPRLMSVGKSHGFHRPLSDDEILITADTMAELKTSPVPWKYSGIFSAMVKDTLPVSAS